MIFMIKIDYDTYFYQRCFCFVLFVLFFFLTPEKVICVIKAANDFAII